MSTPAGFPPVLYEYWHASEREISGAIADGKFKGVSVSSLLKAFLDMQLKNAEGQDERACPMSLKSLALSNIIAELKSSNDLPSVTKHIACTLDSITYRQLLSDARLPYRILRTFLRIPNSDIPGCALMSGRTIIDLEEVILTNDAVVQQSHSSDRDHTQLVTLNDLRSILALPGGNGYESFQRKNPPTGGLEFFNLYWRSRAHLLSNETVFKEVFHVRTAHILRGLNWTNVCVTGEIVLDALTGELSRGATPIRLCLFGLNANEANRKLEDIYNVWVTNLPVSIREKKVIKTAKSIHLFADPQTRVPSLISLARRGFGLRILPSYMKSLVEGIPETKNDTGTDTAPIEKTSPSISQPCMDNGSLHKRSELGVNLGMLQRDSGSKSLKRYALLGRRKLPTVMRGIFGLGEVVDENTCQIFALQSLSWLIELDEAWDSYLSTAPDLYRGRISEPILRYQYLAFPHDQVRDYEEIGADIDNFNQNLFGDLQFEICRRLQIPLQIFGWSNYLTRRIRRNLHGPTLDIVHEKQITIPFMMPWDLEMHIAECLNTDGVASSRSLPKTSPIINVHDPTKHDHTTAQLPSLSATEHERGNLKYWVISNQSMWVGQDKKQDAVADVLWCLVGSYMQYLNYGPRPSTDTDSRNCLLWTIRYLQRKLGTLPGIPSASDDDRRRQGLPTVKESLKFRTFVAGTLIPNLEQPEKPVNDDEWIQGDNGDYEPFPGLSDHDFDSTVDGFPDWTDLVE
ncbi:MAG: hypothetical protein Q9195_003719 [Heterodermia aff. obscurata]